MPRAEEPCSQCGKRFRKDNLARHVKAMHQEGGKGHERSRRAQAKRENQAARKAAREAKKAEQEAKRTLRAEKHQRARERLRGDVNVRRGMEYLRRHRRCKQQQVPPYLQLVAARM